MERGCEGGGGGQSIVSGLSESSELGGIGGWGASGREHVLWVNGQTSPSAEKTKPSLGFRRS